MTGWRTMDSAPKDGEPALLLLGETVPDMPDIRVGSFVDGAYSEALGYREYAKHGGWLIWNSNADFYVIDVADARGWYPPPESSP